MLKEIINDRLLSERRRWFTDEYMDLYVWHDEHNVIFGFQVCFEKDTSEKAFTWLATGFNSFAGVDAGEDSPLKNMAPILIPLSGNDKRTLEMEFKTRSKEIDNLLAQQLGEIIENTANQAL